jgi:hypothetical protein
MQLWGAVKNWVNAPITSEYWKRVGRNYSGNVTGIEVTPATRGELLVFAFGAGARSYGGSVPGSLKIKIPNVLNKSTPSATPIPVIATPPAKLSLGPNAPPQRIQGPWTQRDFVRATNGQGPIDMAPTTNKAGKAMPLEIHHGDQMPGSGVHEVLPSHTKTVEHPNLYNQGVTPQMRKEDSQLHWLLRGQEMGNPPQN